MVGTNKDMAEGACEGERESEGDNTPTAWLII
jgi:hypothetical protein